MLLSSRVGFYSVDVPYNRYFEGPTRLALKKFVKGYIDCEVSIELVRQRICNKLQIKRFTAFSSIDHDKKEFISIEDLRTFI